MEYICMDCGHIFEDGEEKHWVERHGFEDGPGEYMTGCPLCGGAYEQAKHCTVCGKATLEDELFGGQYCKDCLNGEITYDTALRFFEDTGYLELFMFEKVFKSGLPSPISNKLHEVVKEWFLRMKANDILCDKTDLIDLCKQFILDDDGEYGCEAFGDWLKRCKAVVA